MKNLPLSAQVDGEPWTQEPCEINIVHMNQVKMLQAPQAPSSGAPVMKYLDFEGTLF